jgi:hypothetical protein
MEVNRIFLRSTSMFTLAKLKHHLTQFNVRLHFCDDRWVTDLEYRRSWSTQTKSSYSPTWNLKTTTTWEECSLLLASPTCSPPDKCRQQGGLSEKVWQGRTISFVFRKVSLLTMCLWWSYEPLLLYGHQFWLVISYPIRTLNVSHWQWTIQPFTHTMI